MENWKKIVGFNYEISDNGRIRNYKTKQVLKPQTSWNGYAAVTLSMGTRTKRKKFLLHRLVADYFIPNPDNKPEVNHLDLDKRNPHVNNLEWVTKQENMNHAKEQGVILNRKGEDHTCNKLTEKDIEFIRAAKEPYKVLADKFNVHVRTICRVKNRESWTHL